MDLDAYSHDIHRGQQDWLFLIGGTNSVLCQYTRSLRTWWHYRRWAKILQKRTIRFQKIGIIYAHIVVPEKLTIYDHMLDMLHVDVRTAPVLQLRKHLDASTAQACVDLVGPFRTLRDGEPLYLKTDSHWTYEGCFIAYEILCRHLGAEPRGELRQGRAVVEIEYSGDLGIKLTPPRSEMVRLPTVPREAVRVDTCDPARDHEAHRRRRGTRAVYRNDNPAVDPRRVLLFGDSYAHFVPGSPIGMLISFLAETFREVHFIWSAVVDKDHVADIKPDIVVTEIAERFMGQLPQVGYKQIRALRAMSHLGGFR